MQYKNYCFAFNSYFQAFEILTILKKENLVPILFIRYYLVNGLGIDWLIELKNTLQNDFESKDFKIYVEVKKNYGLSIGLIEQKIHFIKLQGNKEILKKFIEIGKANKVLINPGFSVLDLSKIKNIKKKLSKIIKLKY